MTSDVAKPAHISIKKSYELYDEYLTLVGWGITNNSFPSRYLHEVIVKIELNTVCEDIMNKVFNMNFSIPYVYLCTRAEPPAILTRVSCFFSYIYLQIVFTMPHFRQGDSGGPVLRKDSVVAINTGYCPKIKRYCELPEEVINNHLFNVHIETDFYREFINDVIKKNTKSFFKRIF